MNKVKNCPPTNLPSLSRRQWIASAALFATGTALTLQAIHAKRSPKESQPTAQSSPPHLPPAPQSTPDHELLSAQQAPFSYEEFLASFDLRHIHPREIVNPHHSSHKGISNTLPPCELWSHMPATLFVADEIRERLGRPLKLVTSAYRNPTYNRAIGGASRSWHTQNCALDLVYEGGPQEAYNIAQDLRDEGFFTGGIGLYRTFIHLDTRGENATWRG